MTIRCLTLDAALPRVSCLPWRRTLGGRRVSTKRSSPKPRLGVTSVIEDGQDAFMIQKQPQHELGLTDSPELDFLTCIHAPPGSVEQDHIERELERFGNEDDVFTERFLRNILIFTDERSIDKAVINTTRTRGARTIYLASWSHRFPPGPYFFSSHGIYWAWRLVQDNQEAFILSTVPSPRNPNIYEHLSAAAHGAHSLCVAVPSRLYFVKTNDQPLAGLRVGVKDLFHLQGVRTGCGNRAYRSFHSSPAASSSSVVQSLIDKGAIIVGKTKTVEFGGSQEVVGDWAEYFYALNARGDGYLVSTGSSTGSASGLAAYPWLDVTIGTDAGGSVRDPAVVHGIFGLRPSHDGTATIDAIVPCKLFHVPGFMSRSIEQALDFGEQWLNKPLCQTKKILPSRILVLSEYDADNNEVQRIFERWTSDLAEWLHVPVDKFSLEKQWQDTRPATENDLFFNTFSKAFIDILSSDYSAYYAKFHEEYVEKHNRAPYIGKVTQWLWAHGKSISPILRIEAEERVNLHNDWFLKHVLTDDDTLILMPRYNTDYRDEYLPPPQERTWYGFDSNLHASFAGLPNLIVPVGQCRYKSSITQRDSVFPVSLSILAAKGMDIALMDLVREFLADTDRPLSVLTGSAAFSLGKGDIQT